MKGDSTVRPNLGFSSEENCVRGSNGDFGSIIKRESDLCNDRWVEVREWPRAPISMVTNEVFLTLHSKFMLRSESFTW